MRVMVLSPPSVDTDNVNRDSVYGCWCKGKRIGGSQTPPHPLILISSTLEAYGHHSRVVDAQALDMSLAELRERIVGWDAVVINASVMTFDEDAEVLRRLKESNPKPFTIVSGAEATFMPDYCLRKEGVDAIVRQDPEFQIRDIINALHAGEDWRETQGIGYCNMLGEPVLNGDPQLIQNLDEIPLADWSLLEGKPYYFNPAANRQPYVTDLTTRGCYARCTFCMAPGFYGGKVRGRTAENVLAGFRKAIEEGYREVYLRDEMFTSLRDRNKIIFQGMLNEKMDLTWVCSARVDTVDEEMLRLMKKSGCHLIKFGVESGSQEILDRMKKDTTLNRIYKAFMLCRKVGIDTHAHFMVGNVGETRETVQMTLDFAKKIKPTTATFGIMTPYPGTEVFEEVAAVHPEVRKMGMGLNLQDLHSTSYFTEELTELTKEEVEELIKTVHRGFYLRPQYILDRLVEIRSFGQLWTRMKAGIKVVDFALRGDT